METGYPSVECSSEKDPETAPSPPSGRLVLLLSPKFPQGTPDHCHIWGMSCDPGSLGENARFPSEFCIFHLDIVKD